MPTSESGDPNSYPTSFDKPSDGDGPTIKAADVNVAIEALADRTANLNARLEPIESAVTLVNFKSKVAIASLDIAQGGTTTQTQTMFSTGITTAIGDIVEVDLSGTGACKYGSGATNDNSLSVEIFVSENGGTATRQSYCHLGSSTNALAANDSLTEGAIAAKAVFTIATAGTLSVEVRVRFTETPNTGDTGTLLLYRASLRQYRSL